jgi:hypothetical protein
LVGSHVIVFRERAGGVAVVHILRRRMSPDKHV